MERQLIIPPPMKVELDPDVKAVLEFMQANFAAPKLIDIANAVKELAGPLFGRFKTEPNPHAKKFIPIGFRPPLSDETGV